MEQLEDRLMLSAVADAIYSEITPYQAGINNALNAAASLPLVGKQFKDIQQLTSVLNNSLSTLESKIPDVSSGDYTVAVPLPSINPAPLQFNLGLDAFLKVSTAGGMGVAINPVLNVAYHVDGGTVTLNTNNTNLDVGFSVTLPGFQATMSLNGLLYVHAADAGTNFNGHLIFKLVNGSSQVTPVFSGDAHVLLGLRMSFADPALNVSFNPTFQTDFRLDWSIDSSTNQMKVPQIALNNFSLDIDSFMHGFLGDVVRTVQKVTKPIQPFIDVFDTPVPILSAFNGGETIGDLMLQGAGVDGAEQSAFDLLVKTIKVVDSIDLSGNSNAAINFGNISLGGDARNTGGFNFDTSQLQGAISSIFGNSALQSVADDLQQLGSYSGAVSTAGFKFPLLENPSSAVFGILTGQAATLFSYSTGRLHFDLPASVGVGIKGLFGIFLSAGITFDADLTMGYDTAGITKFAQDPQHKPADLLHGFYFDNGIDTVDQPVPNVPNPRFTGVYLEGFAQIEASAIVTLSGGLYANLSFELANTDASSHVYLDTMIQNLTSGGKIFHAAGKLYAAATLSLTLDIPLGPNITLFSYELAHYDLINNDPPPQPDLGHPVTIIDSTTQHTLTLDVNKMSAGNVISVEPFYDFSTSAGYIADGIRVDYANEIVLYVERKNDVTSDYYNFIGLNGTTPDGVTINISDPFRVFIDKAVADPSPTQTKPGVILTGGKNVGYKYDDAFDGTHANVLLAGGYGFNTLTGGTMEFGNFIPAARLDQARSHFGNTSGYDASATGLINTETNAVIAPGSPSGVIGATLSANRGGLMFGGAGANSFIASGAGSYEMDGNNWVDAFTISPSFSDVPATYAIDAGPGGGNSLTVNVPSGHMADFENGTVADKYDPQYKSLDILDGNRKFATADGIQDVQAVGAKGSTIVFGDTSELNINFQSKGSGKIVFGGSPGPDAFDVTATYPGPNYSYATPEHRLVTEIWPNDPTGYGGGPNDFVPGYFHYETFPVDYVAGPFYSITRTFGTNNRTQTIPWELVDVSGASLTLDGRGASDQYHVALGLGTFVNVTVDDSDPTTQNALTVDARQAVTSSGNIALLNRQVTLTDTSLNVDYYTPILLVPVTFTTHDMHFYFGSVHYSPTVYFGSNVDITFGASSPFDKTIIDRPLGLQAASIHYDGVYTTAVGTLGYFPLYSAMDPDAQNPTLIPFVAPGGRRSIEVQHNGGNLSVSLAAPRIDLNIDSNMGTLSFTSSVYWDGNFDNINVLANSGTINISYNITGTYSYYGYTGLTHNTNILASSGTINLNDVQAAGLYAYGIDDQVNIGNGTLDNIHGAINLRNGNDNHFGLKIDDRSGSSSGRVSTIDYTSTQIGDLKIDYTGVNPQLRYGDSFSTYDLYARTVNPTYIVSVYLPFSSRSLNGTALYNGWSIGPIFTQSVTDGDSVNLPVTLYNAPAGTPLFTATGLPPGLSIDSSTGLISGAIPAQSWRNDAYHSTVSVLLNGIGHVQSVDWYVASAIAIQSSLPSQGVEGSGLPAIPITTTDNLNRPVTLSITGLPAGLSFNPATATIIGTIAAGAAQNGPYHVNIHATDGLETADAPFDLNVTGIQFTSPGNQVRYVGESIQLAIAASTFSGAPLTFQSQDLPDGLSINPTTGIITGQITANAAATGSYYSTISLTNGADVQQFFLQWSILQVGISDSVTIDSPGIQTSQAGSYAGLSISAYSSLGLPLTFTVTGLPPGLQLGGEGSLYLAGQIDASAITGSPYNVQVTATDGRWTGQTTFAWNIIPASTVQVYVYPEQITANSAFSDTLYSGSTLNEPITFTATGLPPGITVDPQTGAISGTVPYQAASPSLYQVTITATASGGDRDIKTSLWRVVGSASSNVSILKNPVDGNLVTITSPVNTTLSASISSNAGVTLPGGVQFPFGFLNFALSGLAAGAKADLTISGLNLNAIASYYKYGSTPDQPTNHWYDFILNQQTTGGSTIITGVEIVGNNLVLHLVDGARGDDDLAKNGVIADIGGPVSQVVLPSWIASGGQALWNAGTHTLTVTGPTRIIADPGSDAPIIQASGNAAVITVDPATDLQIHLAGLSLTNGASMVVTSLGNARTATNHRVLVLGTAASTTAPLFNIDSTSYLNLTDNDLVDHQGNLSAITALLKTGLNAGSGYWNGKGLRSSTAAGAQLFALGTTQPTSPGTFDNENVITSDVEVRYTYYGDTNLDGHVDGSDYSRIDNGFLTHATGWNNGDFNYDNLVNGSDYTLMDNAYNTQGASVASQLASPQSQVSNSSNSVNQNTLVPSQPFNCVCTFSDKLLKTKPPSIFEELVLR